MAKRSGQARFWFWAWSALAGLVSGAAFLAAAELVALFVARGSSPILAVGSFVIDIVPRWAKEFAIETFGANDKLVLLLGLAVGVAVAAAVAGVLQFLRPPLGVVALGVAGVLSTAAIVTRAGAGGVAWLSPVVGTIVGTTLLWQSWPDSARGADDVVGVTPRHCDGCGRSASIGGPAGSIRIARSVDASGIRNSRLEGPARSPQLSSACSASRPPARRSSVSAPAW